MPAMSHGARTICPQEKRPSCRGGCAPIRSAQCAVVNTSSTAKYRVFSEATNWSEAESEDEIRFSC